MADSQLRISSVSHKSRQEMSTECKRNAALENSQARKTEIKQHTHGMKVLYFKLNFKSTKELIPLLRELAGDRAPSKILKGKNRLLYKDCVKVIRREKTKRREKISVQNARY